MTTSAGSRRTRRQLAGSRVVVAGRQGQDQPGESSSPLARRASAAAGTRSRSIPVEAATTTGCRRCRSPPPWPRSRCADRRGAPTAAPAPTRRRPPGRAGRRGRSATTARPPGCWPGAPIPSGVRKRRISGHDLGQHVVDRHGRAPGPGGTPGPGCRRRPRGGPRRRRR